MEIAYLDILKLAAPEILVSLAAFVVLAIDLFVTRDADPATRTLINSLFASAGCALAIAWIIAFPADGEFAGGMLVVNNLTRIVKASILVLALFTLLLNLRLPRGPHGGEELALLLLSCTGMLLLAGARDLLMVFVCLELSTVPLYVLTAFDKSRKECAEAGLKFFLLGAVSTAFTLFGFSFLYGLSGDTSLAVVARELIGAGADPLAIIAIVLVIAGIGFKVAAAPFHMWAPDVYEVAPVPAAGFIASASKVAGFFVLGIVLLMGVGTQAGERFPSLGWVIAIGLVSAFSMVLGNLAALVQDNVRRLLAFSAVAHAGYMLLALLSAGAEAFSALVFYASTYGLSTVGAFAVAGAVQPSGHCRMASFNGLGTRAPVLSICMLIFMLSLAGIPPLVGFAGKFYVFVTLLGPGPGSGWRIFLLILAVSTSAISLYYYLKVLKSIYVSSDACENEPRSPAASGWTQAMLLLVALLVLGLGCYPEPLLAALRKAVVAIPL